MSKDIEITDFKNFSQFLVYNRQHAQEMQNWSSQRLQEYCDKVMNLMENNPEFKKQYDKWTKVLEAKQKYHVTIGGTPDEMASSQAWLALKRVQKNRENKKKENTGKNQPKTVASDKRQFTI